MLTGEDLSETRSTSSYASSLQNMASNYKNLALKKHIFAADCFLDLDKLPRKTQQILTKFEMIVIAKVLSINEQQGLEESDTLNIDDIDLTTRQTSQNQEEEKQKAAEGGRDQPKQTTFLCEAMVEQLVAFSDL